MMTLQRWEYLVIYCTYNSQGNNFETKFDEPVRKIVGTQAICNAMGEQGWELVQAHPWVNNYNLLELIFKRPKG